MGLTIDVILLREKKIKNHINVKLHFIIEIEAAWVTPSHSMVYGYRKFRISGILRYSESITAIENPRELCIFYLFQKVFRM